MNKTTDSKHDTKRVKDAARAERLKKALKANMAKRKAQARARSVAVHEQAKGED